MSEVTKKINRFFKFATKSEIKILEDELILSEHLKKVYNMFYIEHKDIDFIAFELGFSRGKIEADLRTIRMKLSKLL